MPCLFLYIQRLKLSSTKFLMPTSTSIINKTKRNMIKKSRKKWTLPLLIRKRNHLFPLSITRKRKKSLPILRETNLRGKIDHRIKALNLSLRNRILDRKENSLSKITVNILNRLPSHQILEEILFLSLSHNPHHTNKNLRGGGDQKWDWIKTKMILG